MTLWQHVLSGSHVFLLLTLNIYSTANRDIWCLFITRSWSLIRAIKRAFGAKLSLLGLSLPVPSIPSLLATQGFVPLLCPCAYSWPSCSLAPLVEIGNICEAGFEKTKSINT